MRYNQFIKESLRLEELENEKKRWNDLFNTLILRDGNYASHPSTGIVYDVRIINKNISILQSKIILQKERLDAEDNINS